MTSGATVEEAYAACRVIARREAKNFYYAFRVLPRHKSDAMCAVYAFMRRADDISDDEALSVEARREAMANWLGSWRDARRGGGSSDVVFVALGDAQRRFGIADELLEDLVRGTTMDLEPGTAGGMTTGMQTFATFNELYRYCYLVASVVGLVSIRIFGYEDERAEKLAEETGVAFQLTNILRDVKEDVERGRVYLPLDMMAEFGVRMERMKALAAGEPLQLNERAMLSSLGVQAERYYRSSDALLPLVDRDSRAALWVMVTIYRELLERIARMDSDVFHRRLRVPTWRKLWILSQGMGLALQYRVLG